MMQTDAISWLRLALLLASSWVLVALFSVAAGPLGSVLAISLFWTLVIKYRSRIQKPFMLTVVIIAGVVLTLYAGTLAVIFSVPLPA